MPCNSDYLEANGTEIESSIAQELIREIEGKLFNHNKRSSHYGNPENLDMEVKFICDWCNQNEDKIRSMSLELQLWWRNHKEADRKRLIREAEHQETIDNSERAEYERLKKKFNQGTP